MRNPERKTRFFRETKKTPRNGSILARFYRDRQRNPNFIIGKMGIFGRESKFEVFYSVIVEGQGVRLGITCKCSYRNLESGSALVELDI